MLLSAPVVFLDDSADKHELDGMRAAAANNANAAKDTINRTYATIKVGTTITGLKEASNTIDNFVAE